MILDDIYLFLKSTGLAQTHAAFSTDYLGHSPRYYDYIRCSGAPPSLRSLLKLSMRLSDISNAATDERAKAIAAAQARQAISQALGRCR